MPKLQTYTESKTFKFSKQQVSAFRQLEKYNVNISCFVRNAIKEKILREYKTIKEEHIKIKLPF